MSATPHPKPRGRWAPTPSGLLHVGNARTALVAWLSIRQAGGTLVFRLEDLDGPRTVPGMAAAGAEDLRWLGLDWDEGPEIGGPHGPYVQSERTACYEQALERLVAADRLFPCRLSRADLLSLATAPHGDAGLPPYPAALRPQNLEPGWLEALRSNPRPDAALRFLVHGEPVGFDDLVHGPVVERVDLAVGDFVLKRRDGVYAYQLAVVIDDAAMAIDEVVRGRDLLASTARQIQLAEALGGRPPRYAHLPLMLDEAGEKLSKRDGALTLAALRAAGVAPERLVGYLAHSLGLRDTPTPCRPAELVEGFAWERLRRDDWTLPSDLAVVLR